MSIGRLIAANSAIIAISILALGRGYTIAAVIAVAVITFPCAGICSAAGACIRGVIGGFICTIFAITACIPPLTGYCSGTT